MIIQDNDDWMNNWRGSLMTNNISYQSGFLTSGIKPVIGVTCDGVVKCWSNYYFSLEGKTVSIRKKDSMKSILSFTDLRFKEIQWYTEPILSNQPTLGFGSICADGGVSPSKGRGTCSHHGGVR